MKKVSHSSLNGTLDSATLSTILEAIDATLRIYNVSHRLILSDESIKDIRQDASYNVIRSWNTFNPSKGSLKTWVSHIVMNCINDFFRNQNNCIGLLEKSGNVEQDGISEYDPYDDYCLKERHEWLMHNIQYLSPRERMVIKYITVGYKPREIAEKMRITPNAVSIILCNAKSSLCYMAGAKKHNTSCNDAVEMGNLMHCCNAVA